jgi:uncharacterized metal-binding protein YceD (DUF177 family)
MKLLNQEIDIRELPRSGKTFELVATAEECAEICERLQIRAVDKATARLKIESLGERAGVLVSGDVEGNVTQACVLTLEDVRSDIAEEFAVRFVNEAYAAHNTSDDFDPDEEDIELFTGDIIDISEVVVQYLSLAMDPYPRAENAEESGEIRFSSGSGTDIKGDDVPHPFAALKKLQDKT